MPFRRALVQSEDRLIFHFLEDKKIAYSIGKNVRTTLQLLENEAFDLIFCSDGEVLKAAKALYPECHAIVLAEIPCVEKAIESIKLGAFDYLTPPFSLEQLETLLEKIEESCCLKKEMPFPHNGKIEQIMAESSIMKQILSDIYKVSKSQASVFICGESGTGKEVIAHAIHFQSPRASFPFIKVNCAAIPDTLIESEFFGHEKGAFTGAIEKRLGRFELAHKGTLLLDEVSEIPLHIQAKLLRVIQEQEFERVGGSKALKVDVRLIATSNRNMKETIEKKLFREDLYYRLNVVPIQLPPLRERREDILSLADHFLERLCLENHKKKKTFSEQAKLTLLDYPWPGNIRELINVLERTVVMDLDSVIESDHLRLDISCPIHRKQLSSFTALTLEEVEKRHILETLEVTCHNHKTTAQTLGITLKTLRAKLRLYNVQ